MSDRLLRGGLARLVLYRTDTGASIDVPAVVIPASNGGGLLDEQPGRVTTAAGTERTVRWDRALQAVISDQLVVEQLQTWQRDGATVKALSIGRARGVHRLWHEAVRIHLQANDAGHGGLAGRLLTLKTAKYAASVEMSDDLNALDVWRDTTAGGLADGLADGWQLSGGPGGAPATDPTFTGAGPRGWQTLTAAAGETLYFWRDVILPAPGLRVRLSTVLTGGASGRALVDDPGDDSAVLLTVQAWRFGAAPSDPGAGAGLGTGPLRSTTEGVVAEGEGNAWLTLPTGTYRVRLLITVEGGTPGLLPVLIRRPRLFTRPESAENLLNGGYLDRGTDTVNGRSTVVIEEFGSATYDLRSETRTFRGVTYDVGIASLGPAALLDLISTDDEAEPHTFHLNTTLPGS